MWVEYNPVDVGKKNIHVFEFTVCPLLSCIMLSIHDGNRSIFMYLKILVLQSIIPNIYGLPVGLIAQLVEHCTGIAEVRIRMPVQA